MGQSENFKSEDKRASGNITSEDSHDVITITNGKGVVGKSGGDARMQSGSKGFVFQVVVGVSVAVIAAIVIYYLKKNGIILKP